MTVVTPPPPSASAERPAPAPDALEALIEEARQRARRRRRIVAAVVLVAGSAAAAFVGFGGAPRTGASARTSGPHTPASIDLSQPTRGRIAFDTVGRHKTWNGVEVVGGGGGKVRTLVRGVAFEPVWSPDGRRLAFSNHEGLSIINADGSGRRLLLRAPGLDLLTWSPDGRRMAFLTYDPRGRKSELAVVDANGSGFRILSAADDDVVAPNGGLAWSPDGKWIAFAAVAKLRIERTTGGHVRILWTCSNVRACVDPSWSPDGSKLLFSTDAGMMIADDPTAADRTTPRLLVPGGGNQRWSPDGHTIAFETNPGETTGPNVETIELMDADGSNQRQLTKGHNPIWSPDGKELAFLRWRGRIHRWGIYTIRDNGTGERLLANTGSVDYPSWGR